jgi:PilZ domain
MQENRKAVRYDIHVPVQVCVSQRQSVDFHAGQLRDISRTGILFHSEILFEVGTTLEPAFCLPAERERNSSVLARATVKKLRTWELPDDPVSLYGIAVTIDWIDFAQPSTSTAAQALDDLHFRFIA